MPKTFRTWFKGLIAAVIGGAAQTALSVVGVNVVDASHPLDYHQLGVVFAAGAVISALMYLAKSPVPPDDTAA